MFAKKRTKTQTTSTETTPTSSGESNEQIVTTLSSGKRKLITFIDDIIPVKAEDEPALKRLKSEEQMDDAFYEEFRNLFMEGIDAVPFRDESRKKELIKQWKIDLQERDHCSALLYWFKLENLLESKNFSESRDLVKLYARFMIHIWEEYRNMCQRTLKQLPTDEVNSLLFEIIDGYKADPVKPGYFTGSKERPLVFMHITYSSKPSFDEIVMITKFFYRYIEYLKETKGMEYQTAEDHLCEKISLSPHEILKTILSKNLQRSFYTNHWEEDIIVLIKELEEQLS